MSHVHWRSTRGSVVFDERTNSYVEEGDDFKRHPAFIGSVGSVDIGRVAFDGKRWNWSSHLGNEENDEGVSEWVKTEDAAKKALEDYVRQWLMNFLPYFEDMCPAKA